MRLSYLYKSTGLWTVTQTVDMFLHASHQVLIRDLKDPADSISTVTGSSYSSWLESDDMGTDYIRHHELSRGDRREDTATSLSLHEFEESQLSLATWLSGRSDSGIAIIPNVLCDNVFYWNRQQGQFKVPARLNG